MNLVGRPVQIRVGPNLSKVGIVDRMEFGIYVVEIGGKEFGFNPDEVEPLFNLQEVAAVHVTEVDEDGDPVGTTHLEKVVKPFGLTSDELAEYVADFVVDAASRVRGVGASQYSFEGYQKFEAMTLPELFEYADEEILDLMNYCVMLRIRLIRLAAALFAADDIVSEEDTDEDSHS
jgi:hypothetical protein